MASVFRAFLERLGAQSAGTFVGDKGDLFFDPDEGTPTIKISDGSTPGGVDISSASGGVQTEIEQGNSKVKVTDTGTDGTITLKTENLDRWQVTSGGHVLPVVNAAYDFGSAEYKVRHLFLSDNSLWVGDDHKVDVEGGKMKFRKRKKSKVPKKIITEAPGTTEEDHETAAVAASSGASVVSDITLIQWQEYARSLGGSLSSVEFSELWPNTTDATDENTYEEITDPGNQQGHEKVTPIEAGFAVIDMQLQSSNVAIIKAPAELIGLNINGAAENSVAEGATFEVIIHIDQAGVIGALNLAAITVNGNALAPAQVTEGNTPVHVVDKLSTYKIYGVFIGSWKVTVVGYPE